MQSLVGRLALMRKTHSGTIDDNKISIMYTLFYSCFPLIASLNEKKLVGVPLGEKETADSCEANCFN